MEWKRFYWTQDADTLKLLPWGVGRLSHLRAEQPVGLEWLLPPIAVTHAPQTGEKAEVRAKGVRLRLQG